MTTSKTAAAIEIRAPLLAFERVHRRTGTIRKTCTFRNPNDQPIELEVRYGFREHSWLQLEIDRQAQDDARLVLPPGESRVHLLMNTDSSNFPYDRFRGRVYFHGDGNHAAHWVEVSFEQIEELEDFDGYAAIDLGTSNSIMALYHLQQDAIAGAPWTPVLEGNGADVPSAVFIRDLAQFRKLAQGSCSVGRAALDDYARNASYDPRALQLGVKRLIGADRVLGVDARGAGGYIDPLNVMQMLARSIREQSQGHGRVRSRLRRLMVTFPPTWDYGQIDRWKEIFRRLGFADEELDLSLDEASAAGLFHVFRWMQDPDSRNRLLQDLMHSAGDGTGDDAAPDDHYSLRLLCFDFGGGTIDLALIGVRLNVAGDVIRLRVTLEGSDSVAFGGDRVTLAVFKILKRRLAMAMADPQRLVGKRADEEQARAAATEASVQSGRFLLPSVAPRGLGPSDSRDAGARQVRERWEDLERHIADACLPSELEDAVDAVFNTRFWSRAEEPIRPSAKQNFSWLWDRAESLKRELFRAASKQVTGLSLSSATEEAVRGGIPLHDLPEQIVGRRLRGPDFKAVRAWVTVGEIYQCIAPPLELAVANACRLAGDTKVDRVVLTGQSSWIPLVRRLFMRPPSEGGFGLAPNKIEFDEDNAKSAVAKGACLLRVLREALVGIDVDVSTFRANLLADIFYRNTVDGARMLFPAGPIDDLRYVEESPDPASFACHLSVLYGTPPQLMGRFDFAADGSQLPSFEQPAKNAANQLELSDDLPTHVEFLRQRDRDPDGQRPLLEALGDWPEQALVAWMEASATAGSPEQPVYRYYLTRNRNLLAVRDRGTDKRLFALRRDESSRTSVPAQENPFSGTH